MPFFQAVGKDAVLEPLEGGGGVAEAGWHHEVLKMPKWARESGFLDTIQGDRQMVLAGGEVKGGEEAGLIQVGEEVLDAGEMERIFLGLLLEPPVVDA